MIGDRNHLKDLAQKGVSPDISKYPDRFNYCTLCREVFQKNYQFLCFINIFFRGKFLFLKKERIAKSIFCFICQDPKLLNCGHFICSQCLHAFNRCYYPGCDNKSPILKQIANLFVDDQDENSVFKFSLQVFDQKICRIKYLKGSATFAQLIDESIISTFREQTCLIIIGCKPAIFKGIKNERIIDSQKRFGLTSKGERCIPIIISQYYRCCKCCESVPIND